MNNVEARNVLALVRVIIAKDEPSQPAIEAVSAAVMGLLDYFNECVVTPEPELVVFGRVVLGEATEWTARQEAALGKLVSDCFIALEENPGPVVSGA